MAGTTIKCPSCGASARSPRVIPPGTMVKCPGCAQQFRLPPDDEVLVAQIETPDSPEEVLDVLPAGNRPIADDFDHDRPRSRSRRDADEDDDRPRSRSRRDADEDDDRPRRTKKKPASLLSRLAFLVVFGLILAGVVVGVAGYAWYSGGKAQMSEKKTGSSLPPGLQGPNQPILGFGGEIATTGLREPADSGSDPGKLSAGAASIFSEPPLSISRPRRLVGPPPAESQPLPAGEAGGTLNPAVLNRVKKATTMIVVNSNDGRAGSGSGFFVGPDLVMTNAHVVGMLALNTKAPKKVEVVLNSGTGADEVICPGHVLAVDRDHDLALLRVSAPGKQVKFPEPLTITAAATLFETQPVWVFGFPLGEQLGKSMTVSPTQVSSLRRDSAGDLDRVQVNGGMEHGNSGGPVVDARGNVIGVAVAGIKETRINFAVPGERAGGLLEGRLATLVVSEPKREGNQYRLAISMTANDPLQKIKDVSLDWWWGAATEQVPFSRAPAASGGGRQRIELKRDASGRFTASVLLDAFPEGKVLWLQPRHREGGTDLNYRGVAVELRGAPQEKPVKIEYRPRKEPGILAVKTVNTTRIDNPAEGSHTLLLTLAGTMKEERLGRNDDSWIFRFGFNKLDAGVSLDDKPLDRSLSILDYAQHVANCKLELSVSETGKVTAGRPTFANVADPTAQRVLGNFIVQLARSIEFASLACPRETIQPGHSWIDHRQLPTISPDQQMQLDAKITYTYRGVRQFQGREVAEFTLAGEPANAPGGDEPTGTMIRGYILADVRTGVVTKADLILDMTTESMTVATTTGKATTTLEIKLQRE